MGRSASRDPPTSRQISSYHFPMRPSIISTTLSYIARSVSISEMVGRSTSYSERSSLAPCHVRLLIPTGLNLDMSVPLFYVRPIIHTLKYSLIAANVDCRECPRASLGASDHRSRSHGEVDQERGLRTKKAERRKWNERFAFGTRSLYWS